ncbi:hypothetical protein MYX65_02740 [Acidobacteria bacterium AH-259-L09]|nr:hypothetical protein [Acidobacteria bacterium AH-259-L09]
MIGEIYEMGPEDVDFLGRYLDYHPELKSSIQTQPPTVWFQDRWKRIKEVRLLKTGIEFRIRGGGHLRFFPEKERTAVRERFRTPFLNLLQSRFPHWKILKILTGTDRNRHQTAALLRLHLWDGRHHLAAVAVYPGETVELTDRVLSSAILWWDHLRRKGCVDRILIFIPECWTTRLLSSFPRLELPLICYEYQLEEKSGRDYRPKSRLKKIYPRSVKSSQLGRPYVIFPYREDVPVLLHQIKQEHPLLHLSFRHGRWELSFRGLRIAWHDNNRDQCFFNLADPCLLTASTLADFEEHLEQVSKVRCFPPTEPKHPYYRLAQERWLESLIVSDHSIFNADFVDVVYSQVPTYLDGERKVLDLLTATKGGRLAVLELKVDKDLDLIFQALDYWERVWHHLKQGDFQRAGYFLKIPLSRESPLLYLISPLFEFHRVMPVLKKYLKEEIELKCVGINSDWKRELTILRKFEF